MNILFVGSNVPNEIEAGERYISSAGNRFQNNLIKNFRKVGHSVSNISFIAVPLTNPGKLEGDKRIVLKTKNIFSSISLFKKRVREEMANADAVMCYNVIYAWLFLPDMCKKYKKKSIAIVADFSEEDSFKSLLRKLYVKLQRRCIRKFDRVVGLSQNISRCAKSSQEFVLVEGGIDREYYETFESCCDEKKSGEVTLMYSGLLEPVTGIDILLEDFRAISNDNLRLVITGKGSMEEEIKNLSKEDSRIIFKGNLPYDEYIETLKGADILINPRNMSLPENKNNFPSKILDYLATGNTIISTRFAGWEKFENNIIFTDVLREAILEVTKEFEKNSQKHGDNRDFASQFIWDNQIKKILE